MNTSFKSFIAVAALSAGLLTPSVGFAQTSLTTTRLTAAIADASIVTFTVASASGFVAGSTSAVIDAEVMDVIAVTGTTIRVVRGLAGTRAMPHNANALVYVGARPFVDSVGRYGACTSANERLLPVLVPQTGTLYTCTSGQWTSASLTGKGGYLTMPVSSGGVPAVTACGATSGNANCANTQTGYTARIWHGAATLSSGSAIISDLSPTFTSTSTGACVGQSQTGTSAGATSKVVISGVSSLTITGTGSEVIWWQCVGY